MCEERLTTVVHNLQALLQEGLCTTPGRNFGLNVRAGFMLRVRVSPLEFVVIIPIFGSTECARLHAFSWALVVAHT